MTRADAPVIMLSAGEASGDLHGATLCRAPRGLDPGLRSVGLGGPPRASVLIVFPEFSPRRARRARRAGVPVVYFIPPQLWAWRRGRIRQMARRVTRVLAAFPFEKSLYEEAGVSVEFVGHPLLDVVPSDLDRAKARQRLGVGERQTLLGLLPGSRRQEIGRLLPPMLDAAARLAFGHGRRCFVLGLAAS